jgi:SAM-dependent methyltransferase
MRCRACNNKLDFKIVDLGYTAISNELVSIDRLKEKQNIYPLELYVCNECYLVQIGEQINPLEIFNKNYVYFSSTSAHWLKHAKLYTEEIVDKLNLTSKSLVVEIASNDGYLLRNFVKRGISCFGIEPTEGTAKIALENGVETLVEFFDSNLAKRLVKDGKQADLIIANNVMAHVPTINDFALSFKKLLKPEGTVTIEFPYLLNMFEDIEFDTIYHEHYFYFSIFALAIVFNKHKLIIYDVDVLSTHGGSLRIYLTHKGNELDKSSSREKVTNLIEREDKLGVNSLKYYDNFRSKTFNIKINSIKFLLDRKLSNKKIVAFGAAAKGNTFLNYCGIKSDLIDFVVDETEYKIGKYLPQSGIPIVNIDKLNEYRPDVIVILPWNHKNEIVKKISYCKEWGAELVTFIPKLEFH